MGIWGQDSATRRRTGPKAGPWREPEPHGVESWLFHNLSFATVFNYDDKSVHQCAYQQMIFYSRSLLVLYDATCPSTAACTTIDSVREVQSAQSYGTIVRYDRVGVRYGTNVR